MITTANLEKYRNGDFIQFVNNVLQIVPEPVAAQLLVASQRATLNTLSTQFNDAFQPLIGNELTPEIANLDVKRDDCVTGIKLFLEAHLVHYQENKRNSAFILLDVMQSYGDRIHKLRYQLETATIDALIHNWESNHPTHLQTLNLIDWKNQLKQYNQDFNNLYINRTLQLAEVENGVMVALRTDATTAYRTLKSHIEAHALINPSDTYNQVMAQMSTLVEQYNTAVNNYTSQEESGVPDEPVTE
jgi:Family of unknown function (DUF6261)